MGWANPPIMYHHDYTQELGLPSPTKIVPLTVALPLLAVVTGCACFGALALGDFERVQSSELAAKAQLEAKEQAVKAFARLNPARTAQVGNRH